MDKVLSSSFSLIIPFFPFYFVSLSKINRVFFLSPFIFAFLGQAGEIILLDFGEESQQLIA
jgi:hypothetical protein